MDGFTLEPVADADVEDWLTMALDLWPEEGGKTLTEVLGDIHPDPDQDAIIARTTDGEAAGFLTISLRRDYVEGSESSPVGYIEGIYVREPFRGRGLARAMIAFAERWSLERGCTEMGSDTLLENIDSHRFHRAVGFDEANRLVAFIKKIAP